GSLAGHARLRSLNTQSGELLLRVARPRGGADGERSGELRYFSSAQGDAGRRGVLLDVGPALGAGDGDDIFSLSEHPRERDLRGLHFVRRGDRLERREQLDVSLEVVRVEARMIAAAVLVPKRVEGLDGRSEEAAPERRVRHEGDTQLPAGREDVLLHVAR